MKFKLDLPNCTIFALVYLASSFAIAETATTSPGRKENIPLALKNMPMNSERRCVGIAAVAEAILEGKISEKPGTHLHIDQLAHSIFDSLSNEARLVYPAELTIQGKRRAITDISVLYQLSSRVAELYKAEAEAVAEKPGGRRKLQTAQDLAVQSETELRQVLAEDEDKTEVLCCFGFREFPDGTYKETYHAVVVRESEDGTLAVFDPNDPGKPITCHFRTGQGNLIVEWRCGYRDSGVSTTQTYQVVPKSRYFRTVRK